MEYLFIGGFKDGSRIAVSPALNLVRFDDVAQPTPWSRSVLYRKTAFAGSTQRFEVFALDGMSGDDIMRALIRGYAVDDLSCKPARR